MSKGMVSKERAKAANQRGYNDGRFGRDTAAGERYAALLGEGAVARYQDGLRRGRLERARALQHDLD